MSNYTSLSVSLRGDGLDKSIKSTSLSRNRPVIPNGAIYAIGVMTLLALGGTVMGILSFSGAQPVMHAGITQMGLLGISVIAIGVTSYYMLTRNLTDSPKDQQKKKMYGLLIFLASVVTIALPMVFGSLAVKEIIPPRNILWGATVTCASLTLIGIGILGGERMYESWKANPGSFKFEMQQMQKIAVALFAMTALVTAAAFVGSLARYNILPPTVGLYTQSAVIALLFAGIATSFLKFFNKEDVIELPKEIEARRRNNFEITVIATVMITMATLCFVLGARGYLDGQRILLNSNKVFTALALTGASIATITLAINAALLAYDRYQKQKEDDEL